MLDEAGLDTTIAVWQTMDLYDHSVLQVIQIAAENRVVHYSRSAPCQDILAKNRERTDVAHGTQVRNWPIQSAVDGNPCRRSSTVIIEGAFDFNFHSHTEMELIL